LTTSTKPSSTVGLMSAFLPFGNSWLASSHRLKDHPWNSTTSYESKSSPFLATLQSLLLQATGQQSRKTRLLPRVRQRFNRHNARDTSSFQYSSP
jgi:hypothetical protein